LFPPVATEASSAYEVFTVTIEPDCPTSYDFTDTGVDPPLQKYVIDSDPDLLITFDAVFLPNTCNLIATPELEIDGVPYDAATHPWITYATVGTVSTLTVSSVTANHAGRYAIAFKSSLNRVPAL